ncbi:MAG: YdeI/OmpD-associated family protein [Candidatus Gracilibacteria bacterium]|nr:YdeI/OmpD-associated family protein [Candidatus Gracilibacteria bacterium]
MEKRIEIYCKNKNEWREWLLINHKSSSGVYLVFYKVKSPKESMRWEEAVKEALCFGWIDSVVKKINDEKRKQLFTPRKPKSGWSKLNKDHIKKLIANNLMHESGLQKIQMAKKDGSWSMNDDAENLIVLNDLQKAFDENKKASKNFQSFSNSSKKAYLHWLYSAKREETKKKRLLEIIRLCEKNIKSRNE